MIHLALRACCFFLVVSTRSGKNNKDNPLAFFVYPVGPENRTGARPACPVECSPRRFGKSYGVYPVEFPWGNPIQQGKAYSSGAEPISLG